MRFSFCTLLLATVQSTLGGVLEPRMCPADNCARAVTGTRSGKVPDVTSRMADCSSFMRTTVQPSTTIVPTQVPAYASACSGTVRYSTACSCWGIGSTTIVPIATYTGVIQVFSGASSLGYMQADLSYYTPQITSNIALALKISFQLPGGATSGSQLNFNLLNDNRGAFLGLVVGRDSTSSNISPGSFNYLYVDPVSSPGTPPGSTPQSIPNYFSTAAGVSKQAETAVWSVNLVDGTVTCQWINTDGSSPGTLEFAQSNHVYAGGDSGAFHGRFPAAVTGITFKFVPV
ncbi:hypothetical protein TWF694_000266 [Orbilia ellipsospora]|uniref:Uncharacterized protein n=1 Tax=Orbilia ellipsospora TaxID=2528407 RepID=A0AAV9XN31_9PEZI